jgi:hypothetical protein
MLELSRPEIIHASAIRFLIDGEEYMVRNMTKPIAYSRVLWRYPLILKKTLGAIGKRQSLLSSSVHDSPTTC